MDSDKFNRAWESVKAAVPPFPFGKCNWVVSDLARELHADYTTGKVEGYVTGTANWSVALDNARIERPGADTEWVTKIPRDFTRCLKPHLDDDGRWQWVDVALEPHEKHPAQGGLHIVFEWEGKIYDPTFEQFWVERAADEGWKYDKGVVDGYQLRLWMPDAREAAAGGPSDTTATDDSATATTTTST